jgi:hypothetical protein
MTQQTAVTQSQRDEHPLPGIPGTPGPNDLAREAPTASRGAAGREALRAWREAGGVTGPRQDPIQKLAANPTSLRLAINAKCWDCQGGDADPNPRGRIGTCECLTCPLHAVRPYQRRDESEAS